MKTGSALLLMNALTFTVDDNKMAYERSEPKWPWRDYLTEDEAETLRRADEAKAEWQRLNGERASITNRAIQRAKYHLRDNPANT